MVKLRPLAGEAVDVAQKVGPASETMTTGLATSKRQYLSAKPKFS